MTAFDNDSAITFSVLDRPIGANFTSTGNQLNFTWNVTSIDRVSLVYLYFSELTGKTGHLKGQTMDKLYNAFKSTHFEDVICSSRRMRGIIMQVFLQIFAFSLQTDRSGRPLNVWQKKGKRPQSQNSVDLCNMLSNSILPRFVKKTTAWFLLSFGFFEPFIIWFNF